ncbi:MAG: YraN family protein [Dehalococcoidales bacterium]|jgi:putative endonuclease
MKKKETGALGERIAGEFLGKNGYEILETNYRCHEGEIDIIAKQAGTLVFVEVRTKRSRTFGSPEESITSVKKKRLQVLAERYGQERANLPAAWRIDVVAIQLDSSGRVSRIELIENAVDGAG